MDPLKINGYVNKTYDLKERKNESENSFGHFLEEAKVQFSKHANMRLDTRNINLTSAQMERLEKATSDARKKGIRDSLIMVDNIALVVNIRNNTVVTAANSESKIFTNIDGAVIA